MRQSRIYLCDECRRRALRGESVMVYLAGPGEFYLDNTDVYKCEHLLLDPDEDDFKRGKEGAYGAHS